MSHVAARILVVDDDPYVRLFVFQALQREPSYTLMEASSKAEALALHLAHRFDLILTDLRMEQVDAGVNLLEAVKQHSPETVVILLTAYATIDTAIASVRAHADDYLTKPISITNLCSSVAKALAAYWQRKAERAALQQIASVVTQLHDTGSIKALDAAPPMNALPADQYLSCGMITLDVHKYEAMIEGACVDLTATEFALMRTLLLARGRTVTFEHLVADVYQQHLDREAARSLLASHVRNLRRKLGEASPQLVNVRGIGYYLAEAVPEKAL